jgi:hypothetical protein
MVATAVASGVTVASGVRRPASGIRHPASGIRHPASATRKLFLGAVGNSSTTPTKWKLAVVGVPCLPRGSPVNRLSCSEAPAVAGGTPYTSWRSVPT